MVWTLSVLAGLTQLQAAVLHDHKFEPLKENVASNSVAKQYQPVLAYNQGCGPTLPVDAYGHLFLHKTMEDHCHSYKLSNTFTRKGLVDSSAPDGAYGILYAFFFSHDRPPPYLYKGSEIWPLFFDNSWHAVVMWFASKDATAPHAVSYTQEEDWASEMLTAAEAKSLLDNPYLVIKGFNTLMPDWDHSLVKDDLDGLVDWDLMSHPVRSALANHNFGSHTRQRCPMVDTQFTRIMTTQYLAPK